MVVAGYVLISFINDNIIRPRLIKHGFEINFVEMFFSLLFWGWVFGPVGTILADPAHAGGAAGHGAIAGRAPPRALCNASLELASPSRG